jgi:hypothetical protein
MGPASRPEGALAGVDTSLASISCIKIRCAQATCLSASNREERVRSKFYLSYGSLCHERAPNAVRHAAPIGAPHERRIITAAAVRDLAAACYARFCSGHSISVARPERSRRRQIAAAVVALAVTVTGISWWAARNAKVRWARQEAPKPPARSRERPSSGFPNVPGSTSCPQRRGRCRSVAPARELEAVVIPSLSRAPRAPRAAGPPTHR